VGVAVALTMAVAVGKGAGFEDVGKAVGSGPPQAANRITGSSHCPQCFPMGGLTLSTSTSLDGHFVGARWFRVGPGVLYLRLGIRASKGLAGQSAGCIMRAMAGWAISMVGLRRARWLHQWQLPDRKARRLVISEKGRDYDG